MKILASSALGLCLVTGISDRADAVMFLETADPLHNTTTPGDNSGWQYEGKFIYFLGVPIAPHFFVTAKHFGGTIGTVFDFRGDTYTTIGYYETVFSDEMLVSRHYTASGYTETPISGTATTDLRVWEVNHAKPFPTYAPLSSGAYDIGAIATVFGRGTEREALPWIVGGESKGWKWGPSSDVQRWGRNVIAGSGDGGPSYGELLYCEFNNPGIANECHLSTGDSGGGVFVLEDGLWRLAGINLGVDGPNYRIPAAGPVPAGPSIAASLFDMGGLERFDSPNWTPVADTPADKPSSFYSTRISTSLPWIEGIPGMVPASSLALESFSAWQKLYFTPTQIATPATTGALADFDADGISNLLEFALNTEPIFNARTTMTAATGFSGLPLVLLENISGADHVTIEFVRRTAGSGSSLTYIPQFSSNLTTWEAVGTETVTAINSRWERVKVVDPETTGSATKRLARLKVTLAP